MAIKKSDLYSSLWASCDELRGGMDASQYKDYVLFMLFIKYITDKYGNSNDFAPPVTIPKGASFKDMLALRGKSDIGDKINTQVIAPLVHANDRLARSDFPDFNDSNKLGEGQAKVERLTNLIGIFEKPELDFSQNRADHDDILGDAYEYLMRHFATESGKSKGQFYTPAEVSRVIAKVIGISPDNTKASTTAYDPTCGSGSLLLKVAAEAGKHITLEGQEKDVTTAGLGPHEHDPARLPDGQHPVRQHPGRAQVQGRRAAPHLRLRRRQSAVLRQDLDHRHHAIERPVPALRVGRAARQAGRLRLPAAHHPLHEGHGQRRLHPAPRRPLPRQCRGHDPPAARPLRLPQGHHRPAREPLLRHRHPRLHRGARQGERRRPQGRLHDRRLQGLHQGRPQEPPARAGHPPHRRHLHQTGDVPRYARLVPLDEIADPKNDFNLNLPRYIDSTEPEDLQDIDGHLRGGIPERDLDALGAYWKVLPSVPRRSVRVRGPPRLLRLKLPLAEVKPAILGHAEFAAFQQKARTKGFADWRKATTPRLTGFDKDGHPKALIETIAEDLLAAFRQAPLLDAYDVYQHLMDYWAETMQDDCYLIAADGWVKGAQPREIVQVKDKDNKLTWPEPHDYLKGKRRFKSDLVPHRFWSPATSLPNAMPSKRSTTSSPRSSNNSTRCARRTAARKDCLPR